jgi:hypothetical protein
MTTVELFLRQIVAVRPPLAGYAYNGPEDFVLRHGQRFVVGPRPDGVGRGVPHCCYGNALGMALVRGWAYVEGFALPRQGILPVQHAWSVLPDGRPVDVTWAEPGEEYVGVVFSAGRADDCTWNGDMNVLDDWKRDWPLLREPWLGEDFTKQWSLSPAARFIIRTKGRRARA